MSKLLPNDTIDRLNQDLFVYDVEQMGWEHEGKGAMLNFRHVLLHLAKDITTKDFYDEEVVKSTIAPDSLQYALRLCRWTGKTATEHFWSETAEKPKTIRDRVNLLTHARGQHIRALGIIASELHDLDHDATRDDAVNRLGVMAGNAAGFLASSTYNQVLALDFDIELAFDGRLSALRHRYNIPGPDKT